MWKKTPVKPPIILFWILLELILQLLTRPHLLFFLCFPILIIQGTVGVTLPIAAGFKPLKLNQSFTSLLHTELDKENHHVSSASDVYSGTEFCAIHVQFSRTQLAERKLSCHYITCTSWEVLLWTWKSHLAERSCLFLFFYDKSHIKNIFCISKKRSVWVHPKFKRLKA